MNICILKSLESDFSATKKTREECSSSENTCEENFLDEPHKKIQSSYNRHILTEFRQPLQVRSHLEMPRILVQLGHTQRTQKLAPQTDPKWSPTWSLTRF